MFSQHDDFSPSPAGFHPKTQECVECGSKISAYNQEKGKYTAAHCFYHQMQECRYHPSVSSVLNPDKRMFRTNCCPQFPAQTAQSGVRKCKGITERTQPSSGELQKGDLRYSPCRIYSINCVQHAPHHPYYPCRNKAETFQQIAEIIIRTGAPFV